MSLKNRSNMSKDCNWKNWRFKSESKTSAFQISKIRILIGEAQNMAMKIGINIRIEVTITGVGEKMKLSYS